MSYENPVYQTLSYNDQDYGNGDITHEIRPSRGATRGRVESILVHASEVFNQVTTQGLTQVGVASDLDAFAELQMGALASGAGLSDGDQTGVFVDDGQFDLSQETEDELTLTLVAPTGGTPTGIANVFVTIAWFY